MSKKIVNIALLKIVEGKVCSSPTTKESEAPQSLGPDCGREESECFESSREEYLAGWREDESESSDEEHFETGAAGLDHFQGATGLLFQEHFSSTMLSQHKEEFEDESDLVRQAMAASQEEILAGSLEEQEERDQEALMCALALSLDEQ